MLGGLTVALAQFLAEQLSCELGEEVWDLTVLKTGRTVVWGCRKASVRVDLQGKYERGESRFLQGRWRLSEVPEWRWGGAGGSSVCRWRREGLLDLLLRMSAWLR